MYVFILYNFSVLHHNKKEIKSEKREICAVYWLLLLPLLTERRAAAMCGYRSALKPSPSERTYSSMSCSADRRMLRTSRWRIAGETGGIDIPFRIGEHTVSSMLDADTVPCERVSCAARKREDGDVA